MHQLAWIGIIRHGESVGNVAASTAEEKGSDLIDITERDADVPLSDTGQKQAEAVAGWLDELPDEERPDVVIDAAARVGGIYANDTYSADFLSENLQIQVNLMDAANAVEVGHVTAPIDENRRTVID